MSPREWIAKNMKYFNPELAAFWRVESNESNIPQWLCQMLTYSAKVNRDMLSKEAAAPKTEAAENKQLGPMPPVDPVLAGLLNKHEIRCSCHDIPLWLLINEAAKEFGCSLTKPQKTGKIHRYY